MKIIDLTCKIHEDMPVFPGDPAVSFKPVCTFEQNGCRVTELCMGSHTGTHIDAPRHFLEDGDSTAVTEIPLDSLVGEAVCVRAELRHVPGEQHPVMDLSDEVKALIRPGDRVILSTGWEAKAGTPAFFHEYPIFAKELLTFLLGKEIRMIGIDLPTVESSSDPKDSSAMHKIILARGIIPVEGLVNLSELIGRRFFFSAAPLSLKDGDGSPVRAYAMMEE